MQTMNKHGCEMGEVSFPSSDVFSTNFEMAVRDNVFDIIPKVKDPQRLFIKDVLPTSLQVHLISLSLTGRTLKSCLTS